MNPLIFQFKESPSADELNLLTIEYDECLNLNVDRLTRRPAIVGLDLLTETFTRMGEGADSDQQNDTLLTTVTATKVQGESSDTDACSTDVFLTTRTVTTAHDEGSDTDVDPPELPL